MSTADRNRYLVRCIRKCYLEFSASATDDKNYFVVETPIRFSKLINYFDQNNHNNEPQRFFINSLLKYKVFFQVLVLKLNPASIEKS